MKRHSGRVIIIGAGMFLAVGMGVRADVLYSDATTDTGNVLNFVNGQEIGDEVLLDNTLPNEYLTNFSFEYYSPDTSFTGNVQADIRLYKNDGAAFNGYNTPGTLFYDSGFFDVVTPQEAQGMNAATLVVELPDLLNGVVPLNPNMVMPTDFTLSVTFQGLQGGDSVGVSLFDPATVGSNYGDYWFNNGGSWELRSITGTSVAFGAQFLGSPQPVPEPSALGLGLVGMALLAGVSRWRQGGRGNSDRD